jgi:hypothetical protein
VKEEEAAACTFSPTRLTKKSVLGPRDKGDDEPLLERLEKQSARKQFMTNVLSEIKSELEVADCTFAPRVNKAPPAVAAARKSSGKELHDRLFEVAVERKLAMEEKVTTG